MSKVLATAVLVSICVSILAEDAVDTKLEDRFYDDEPEAPIENYYQLLQKLFQDYINWDMDKNTREIGPKEQLNSMPSFNFYRKSENNVQNTDDGDDKKTEDAHHGTHQKYPKIGVRHFSVRSDIGLPFNCTIRYEEQQANKKTSKNGQYRCNKNYLRPSRLECH